MRFLEQNRTILPLFFLIIAVYFILRLPNLTLQPIFADEAIYIRWAQIMKSEPTLRFISLQDGKTPLFMWLMIPLFKIVKDPLLAGRLLSVFAGFMTLLGAVFLGWKFFNKKIALWAGLLIAVTPFTVFFDRMALVDSMLAAFSIWSLVLGLLLVQYLRLDLAFILGYLLGGGMLVKTPGLFNLLVLPVTLLSFKRKSQNFIKLLMLWIIAIVTAMVIYNVLRLGPGFDNLSSRNQDYVHSPLRLLQYPLDPLIPHLRDLADWFPKLLTIPILVIIMIGSVWMLIQKNKVGLVILGWALFPLIVEMLLLQTFTARYILFSIPPLIFLGAIGIDSLINQLRLKPAYLKILIALLILLPLPLMFDIQLLKDPALAPLPREERRGYLEDWTAGYNLKEVAQFLTEQSKVKPIVVGTEGSFGTLPDGLWIYLDKTPNITIIGGKAGISDQLLRAVNEHPTFYVANKSRFYQYPSNVKLIKQYPKAVGPDLPQDYILLFQVFPESL